METDVVGYPKRNAGDKLVINGYQTIVIENQGLAVLCPCPDTLLVQWPDGSQSLVQNDDYLTWS